MKTDREGAVRQGEKYMSKWQTLKSAPKDGTKVLLYGKIQADDKSGVTYKTPFVFSGYYDSIDESWCADGSHWDGPFFTPTHWMPLPKPPKGIL